MNKEVSVQNHFVNTSIVTASEISTFPESYRPLILICFGLYGWIAVLALLKWQRIDVNALLLNNGAHSLGPLCIFAFLLTLMISCHIFLLEHVLFTRHIQWFNHFRPVVLCYSLALLLALFGPCQKESQRFFKRLYRLLFRLNFGQTYFSDVLVTDILISFSGVFTGIFIKLMQAAKMEYMQFAPFVTSIPYLLRLKQCLNDYFAQQSQYRSKRQLINAVKYASTLPAIFLQQYKPNIALMGELSTEEMILWRLWLVSTLGSSMFAFSWDLAMDWDLVQINFYNNSMPLLKFRKNMHFSNPFWYVIAAALNGCLRALKIGSHLHHVHPFCVDFAEIVRRWIWAIFRFENEWIKRSYIDIEGGNTMEETHNSRDMYVNTGNMLSIPPVA